MGRLQGVGPQFTIANAAVTERFRTKIEDEPPIVIAFGTSFGFACAVRSLTGREHLKER